MKTKISIALPKDILAQIDRHREKFGNRSKFFETAARAYLTRIAGSNTESRDFEIINRRADALNREALDVLSYPARSGE